MDLEIKNQVDNEINEERLKSLRFSLERLEKHDKVKRHLEKQLSFGKIFESYMQDD